MNKKSKKILYLIISILIVYFYNTFIEENLNTSYSNSLTTDLKILFFDVGQADSIFISNNNYNMLIDAGNNEDGPKLVEYISDILKVKKIDYLVGTHPHEDHIGGLDDIIKNFDIGTVMLPEAITTTKTFEDVISAIEKKDVPIYVPKTEEKFALGEANFEVIHIGTDEEDLNNSSIVLKMIFGEFSYLFTGDATSETEKIMLNKNIDVDVLKVAHHGSAYSTSSDFLKKVTPKYAIISVAKENSYGHPASSTLKRLKKYTKKIYLTSQSGTIFLTSDGKKINITSIKTDTNG